MKIISLEKDMTDVKADIVDIKLLIKGIDDGLFRDKEDGTPCLSSKINTCFKKDKKSEESKSHLVEHTFKGIVTIILLYLAVQMGLK